MQKMSKTTPLDSYDYYRFKSQYYSLRIVGHQLELWSNALYRTIL